MEINKKDCKSTWAIFNKKTGEFMLNAYQRWLDEQEYEDINDYKDAIEELSDFPIMKITKRPFEIYIKCSDGILCIKASRKGKYITLIGRTIKSE